MSAHEQAKANRAADSRPAFGIRATEARAHLHEAEREIATALTALEDARRGLGRREIGGAEWQVRRAEERLKRALQDIGRAGAAVTIEDAEPFAPF